MIALPLEAIRRLPSTGSSDWRRGGERREGGSREPEELRTSVGATTPAVTTRRTVEACRECAGWCDAGGRGGRPAGGGRRDDAAGTGTA